MTGLKGLIMTECRCCGMITILKFREFFVSQMFSTTGILPFLKVCMRMTSSGLWMHKGKHFVSSMNLM